MKCVFAKFGSCQSRVRGVNVLSKFSKISMQDSRDAMRDLIFESRKSCIAFISMAAEFSCPGNPSELLDSAGHLYGASRINMEIFGISWIDSRISLSGVAKTLTVLKWKVCCMRTLR